MAMSPEVGLTGSAVGGTEPCGEAFKGVDRAGETDGAGGSAGSTGFCGMEGETGSDTTRLGASTAGFMGVEGPNPGTVTSDGGEGGCTAAGADSGRGSGGGANVSGWRLPEAMGVVEMVGRGRGGGVRIGG